MGVGDRDYMKDRPGGLFLNSDWRLRILLAGVVGTVFAMVFPRGLVAEFVLSPDALASWRVWTPLTAPFVHIGFGEAVFTLFGWWVFGGLVEQRLGPWELVRFACFSVALGLLSYLAVGSVVDGPVRPYWGYHGLVMAAVAYAVLRFPQERLMLFFILPVPMWLIGVVYAAASLSGRFGGGAAVGMDPRIVLLLVSAAYGLLCARHGVWPAVGFPNRRHRSRAGEERLASAVRPGDEQRRVDALLDKISEEGIGALSDEERAFLERASKRYR